MKRTYFALAILACMALAGSGYAQVEADPNKNYAITPEAGPWMIYATHYVGAESLALANQMALEIRRTYKVPAWVLDRGEDERKKQKEHLRQIHEQYNGYGVPYVGLRTIHIEEQCAVLIGGYKDAPTANRALKDLKASDARITYSKETARLCPVVTVIKVEPKASDVEEKQYIPANPFNNSFVTRNPTVPQQQTTNKDEQALIKKLNANESYSALKCKKPYTLVVAAYSGASTFQTQSAPSSFFDRFWGNHAGEALAASGLNAHTLAEVLRSPQLKFESYVLHLRGGSLVTIGGFDKQDDPRIETLKQALVSNGKTPGVMGLQTVPQPFVIEIPR